MTFYKYQAQTKLGDVQKGEIEAPDVDVARNHLEIQGFVHVKIRRDWAKIELKFPGSESVPTREMMIFTRQFATMIDAGLPIVQCLDMLGGKSTHPALAKTIRGVKSSVESGKTLAESMSAFPNVFDKLFCNLISAGELGGVLDTVLNRLAAYIERESKLRKQATKAASYPLMMLGLSLTITAGLLYFVVPKLAATFKSMGKELPGPTQLVIDISDAVAHNIVAIILGIFGLIMGIRYILSTKMGRRLADELLLALPLIGPVVQKIAVARFTRTMGTMLSSGVNILEALDNVASGAGNTVVEEGLRYVRTKLSEGKTLAEPLGELKVFPPMVVQMIAVGESSGSLDIMLNKIADFYDDEVENAIGSMTAALEPLIMVVVACMVGSIIIAMYLPIFNLAGGV